MADMIAAIGRPNLIATVGRPPVEVHFGENATATIAARNDAESFAASALTSAAFAEEFSGPAYATIGDGETATTPGQFFRVPVPATDPVEYTRYQRTVAGSVVAAPLATTVALGSPAGGGMVGLDLGLETEVTSQILASAQTSFLLYSSLFPSLKAAIQSWMLAGGTLVINQDYLTETTVFGTGDGTFLAGKAYRLETQGARTIKYTGAATPGAMHRWYASGAAALTIDCNLTFDGNNLAASGLFIDYSGITGSNRRNCIVRGLTCRNNRLAVAHSLGANGLVIRGGFDLLHLDNITAENVTRAAGTGVVGSYGCTGIQYFGDAASTANARRIVVEKFAVRNITSEDTVGTSAFGDMDGLLLFQYAYNGDPVVGPIIRNGEFKDCVGRCVKRYAPGFGGITESILIERSVRGRFGGANEIVHQDGSGIIRDITIRYSGDANIEPSSAIITAPSSSNNNKGAVVDGVRIEDSTGAPMFALVSTFGNFFDSPNRRAYTFRNIYHNGTAQCFTRLGWNATVSDVDITLENIDCSLIYGVGMGDDPQQYLRVRAYNFCNRGAAVPAKVQIADPALGAMAPTAWGDWWGDEDTIGVHRYVGVYRNNSTFKNGFRGPGGGVLDAPPRGICETFGRVEIRRVTIAAGATHVFPAVGSYEEKGGNCTIQIVRQDLSIVPPINLFTQASSTVLAFLYGVAPGGWDIRSTGSGSGAGTNIEVWKDDPTQALTINNRSGADMVVDVTFNP